MCLSGVPLPFTRETRGPQIQFITKAAHNCTYGETHGVTGDGRSQRSRHVMSVIVMVTVKHIETLQHGPDTVQSCIINSNLPSTRVDGGEPFKNSTSYTGLLTPPQPADPLLAWVNERLNDCGDDCLVWSGVRRGASRSVVASCRRSRRLN